jgi:hypothetical protein
MRQIRKMLPRLLPNKLRSLPLKQKSSLLLSKMALKMREAKRYLPSYGARGRGK